MASKVTGECGEDGQPAARAARQPPGPSAQAHTQCMPARLFCAGEVLRESIAGGCSGMVAWWGAWKQHPAARRPTPGSVASIS